jgi:hypothetical protein
MGWIKFLIMANLWIVNEVCRKYED